jgi:hypothetical protein
MLILKQLTIRFLIMNRIYHTWDKWECYPAGFFEVHPPKGMTDEDCLNAYKELLLDIPEFKRIMRLVIREWRLSCEHNLTNERMNRIAWMGQASLCYKHKIPSRYRGAYNLLSKDEQLNADQAALEVINEWLELQGYDERHDLKSIQSKTEMDLY